MKKLILTIVVLACSLNLSFGQAEADTLSKLKNNAVYINGGTILFSAAVSLNYERMLVQHIGNIGISSFLRVGVGRFWTINGDGGFTTVRLGLLTGKRDGHLELAFGFNADYPNFGFGDKPPGHPLAGNLGWRYQSPNENLMIRIGVGVPEFAYVGVGWSF